MLKKESYFDVKVRFKDQIVDEKLRFAFHEKKIAELTVDEVEEILVELKEKGVYCFYSRLNSPAVTKFMVEDIYLEGLTFYVYPTAAEREWTEDTLGEWFKVTKENI